MSTEFDTAWAGLRSSFPSVDQFAEDADDDDGELRRYAENECLEQSFAQGFIGGARAVWQQVRTRL